MFVYSKSDVSAPLSCWRARGHVRSTRTFRLTQLLESLRARAFNSNSDISPHSAAAEHAGASVLLGRFAPLSCWRARGRYRLTRTVRLTQLLEGIRARAFNSDVSPHSEAGEHMGALV